MKISRWFPLRTVSFCLAAATCLDASVVLYDQPVLNQTDRGSFSDLSQQQIADQFMLSFAASITGVRWSGSYFNFDLSPSVTNIAFVIRFFADTSGLPVVTPFYSANVSAAVADSGVVFEGRKIYTFSVDSLPTSVPVLGGVQTWISILESDKSPNFFEWANSTVGPNAYDATRFGDGSVWNQQGPGGIESFRGNQAFTLTGTAVPEPSSLVVLGIGLAAIFIKKAHPAPF